jgi:hypothetical protein
LTLRWGYINTHSPSVWSSVLQWIYFLLHFWPVIYSLCFIFLHCHCWALSPLLSALQLYTSGCFIPFCKTVTCTRHKFVTLFSQWMFICNLFLFACFFLAHTPLSYVSIVPKLVSFWLFLSEWNLSFNIWNLSLRKDVSKWGLMIMNKWELFSFRKITLGVVRLGARTLLEVSRPSLFTRSCELWCWDTWDLFQLSFISFLTWISACQAVHSTKLAPSSHFSHRLLAAIWGVPHLLTHPWLLCTSNQSWQVPTNRLFILAPLVPNTGFPALDLGIYGLS